MFYRELAEVWGELTAPGAPFEMETVLQGDVPTRVFRQAPATVPELWLPTARFAERDYIVYHDERVTYAQAHADANAVACWLAARNIGRGQRVALAMRNYPEWMIAYWGCLSIGVCVVGINAWWTGPEIAYALDDSKPDAIFCDPERLERISPHLQGLPETRLVVTRAAAIPARATAWTEVVATPGELPRVELAPDDEASIFYTSGTSGFPRGAVLTHRNCVTNIYNIMFAGRAQSLAAARGRGEGPPEAYLPVTLIPTPFFHVTGSNCLAYSVTVRGGTMVLMYKWDAAEALSLIERERINEVSGVPVMTREIVNHPDLAHYDTSSLTSIAGGGASFQGDLIGKVLDRLPSARPRTGYGMTETAGSITTVSAEFLMDRPETVGRVLPAFDVRFVDEDGRDAGPCGPGELWVRGGAVFKGYLHAPDATGAALTEGWLHTGDLARMDDDGFLYIIGRQKDMVIRGGENVYCAEVENVLQQHPAVAECCVFGIPDERLGEAVAAAVVMRPGAVASPDELGQYLCSRLAQHKIPARFWLLDQPIPRNATGKFMKRDLREILLLQADRQGNPTQALRR